MKCEDVRDLLDRAGAQDGTLELRFAYEHLRSCPSCRDAAHAVHVLKADATRLVPGPSEGAFDRAMLAAARTAAYGGRPNRGAFWQGLALGGALAAGLALAAVLLVQGPDRPADRDAAVTPVVSIAPNAVREISISLDSPEPLADAGIRVVLSGAIALSGYEDLRELRWSTQLDQGANTLTLPVVALGPGGGQLLVEVAAGAKRRTFLVDVRSQASI